MLLEARCPLSNCNGKPLFHAMLGHCLGLFMRFTVSAWIVTQVLKTATNSFLNKDLSYALAQQWAEESGPHSSKLNSCLYMCLETSEHLWQEQRCIHASTHASAQLLLYMMVANLLKPAHSPLSLTNLDCHEPAIALAWFSLMFCITVKSKF